MPRVRVLGEARREYAEAVRWYRKRDIELAHDMVHEYLQTIGHVRQFPKSGTVISDLQVNFEVRRFLLDRFPYSVVVALINDEIIVVAVAHQHREPGYWHRRLAEVKR